VGLVFALAALLTVSEMFQACRRTALKSVRGPVKRHIPRGFAPCTKRSLRPFASAIAGSPIAWKRDRRLAAFSSITASGLSEEGGSNAEPSSGAELSPLRTGPSSAPRVVVLGGGFGGLNTALKLSELKWDQSTPEITLVDVSERFLFKPLMYELITGEATLDQVAPLFRDLLGPTPVRFVNQKVKDVTLADVGGNTAGRIHLDGSEQDFIDYDYLVVGLGAETNLELAEGAKEFALPFNTLDDVRELEQRLQDIEDEGRSVSVAVVGGGAGGVELAASVADRLQSTMGDASKGAVKLYVGGSDVMEDFAEDAREVAREALEKKGIEVLTNQRVEKVAAEEGEGKQGKYSVTVSTKGQSDPLEVSYDLVLWTAGQKATPLAGLSPSAEVKTPMTIEPTLRVTDREREFALGDIAGMQFPATAQVAMQQADYCAWNLFASINSEPMLNFRYQHLGKLTTLGSLAGTATLNLPGVGEVTLKGPVASALRKLAYVYRMPTNQQRLKVGSEWLQNPEMWVPPELPKDIKDLEKLNPFVGAPNLDKLFDEKEVKDALQGLYERIQAERGKRV